jgi:hypothetical protein
MHHPWNVATWSSYSCPWDLPYNTEELAKASRTSIHRVLECSGVRLLSKVSARLLAEETVV